jgi:hypothetical protein
MVVLALAALKSPLWAQLFQFMRNHTIPEFGLKARRLSLTIVGFAALYHWGTNPDDFSGQMPGFFNKLYFSTTTLSTVGFGDISPVTKKAKLFVMLEMMMLLLHLVD